MPRMRFAKTGSAVWISHLDLMRALQRSFRRAGIALRHSQGFSPHPLLSIALPLSVGVSSDYEIADFELENGETAELSALPRLLNEKLPKGITVLDCRQDGKPLKHLRWLEAELTLCYDAGVPENAAAEIAALFQRQSLCVEKHGKNGPVTVDVIPMLRGISLSQPDSQTLLLRATVSAQNPTLNPLLLVTAIQTELSALSPDFFRCHRVCLYDELMQPFV